MSSNLNTDKRWVIAGAIILGFLLLLGGFVWAINTFSFKMGTVDMSRIVKSSKYGQNINKELQEKGKALTDQLKASSADKTKIQAEIQQLSLIEQNKFLEKVNKIIAKVAKSKGVKLIGNSQAYAYSEFDLTNDVIKELDK